MFLTTTQCRIGHHRGWSRLVPLVVLVFLIGLAREVRAQSVVTNTQSFSFTGQIVTYIVPTGVTSLTIEARGAEGADIVGSTSPAGKGAILAARVNVTPGQSLSILVGQRNTGKAGGGGGSFVVGPGSPGNPTPLVIAGGGGGANQGTDSPTKHGQLGTAGGAGSGNGAGTGGTARQGGTAGNNGGAGGGGGGGLQGNGAGSMNDPDGGGKSFVNGGAAGSNDAGFGGFGGGGSGRLSNGLGGGGGGYSGGGGSGTNGAGGGGGSFSAGTQLFARTGATDGNSDNGLVIISYSTQLIRYVKQDGMGTGTSWADASGDLQSQINATGVQQVWVAGGTYKPGPVSNTDRSISFNLKNGVAVYGGFAGTETMLSDRVLSNPSSTTLLGDIGTPGNNADNTYSVVANLNVDNSARLDGFVITGGNATGNGGGINNNNSTPVLANLTIVRNRAAQGGGGIFNTNTSGVRITNSTISSNTATNGGGIHDDGEINSSESNPVLINCLINNNTATGNGGGIYNRNSASFLFNSTLADNRAGSTGGGIYNTGNADPVLTNTVVWNNGGATTFVNATSNASTGANYCLIESSVTGYSPGMNNRLITSSPFVSASDYRLNACSVGIDAGSNSDYNTVGGPATDLAGNPRFYQGGTIDIGAYEYQGNPSQPVAITQQPASGTAVCVGATVTASVSVSGTSPSYQWYKDNLSSPVTGQTSATLTLTNVQTSQAGSYSVVVTGACNSVTSTAFSLTVNPPPTATISASPSTTLTCAQTSLTLTASGGSAYTFSANVVSQSGNQAVVNQADVYSVTVTNGSTGCSSTTSITISQDASMPMVSITANPSLTIAPGQSTTLTANVTGGTAPFTYRWNTGVTSNTIVANMSGPYSVTATGNNGCSGAASTTVTVSGPFAITGVTTVDCTPILPNRFSLSFTPRYQGLDGTPVSFSVTNELLPTTNPGPYTLQLYTDNPVITLQAVQSGVTTSFAYRWLEACNSSTGPNTPPRVVNGIPSQTATVGQYFSYVIPEGTFTDTETPGSLRLSARGVPPGLSFAGATLSGTPSTTVGSPFSVTITATDPGNFSVSTSFSLTVLPASGTPPPTGMFSITGVTTISCTPVANRINLVFSPRYAGMSGQPIAFEVVNESAPTTDPAPYSLTLYRDNPVITLRATQTGSAGPVSFSYNWLAACASVGQDNTPPRLNDPVRPQSATVGVGYSLNLINTFIDQETPEQISLSAVGLPAGLLLSGKMISGTPSMSGVTSVTLTATDGGGLSTSTSFTITVQPGAATPPPNPGGPFSITGVTTVSCEVISAGERRLTFNPRYGGDNGSPISFSVVSELSSTTNPGPYSLRLYTDNPAITLSAVQSGVSTQFRYNWLAACSGGARIATEPGASLQVRVLGNPVLGDVVEVEVRGAAGQSLRASLVDERGQGVSSVQVPQAGAVEALTLKMGRGAGVYLLQVSTPAQQRALKLIKP